MSPAPAWTRQRANSSRQLAGLRQAQKYSRFDLLTHHIEEILPLFKKTLVLRGGKVLHAGPTRRVLQRNLLKQLYGVVAGLIEKKGRYCPP